MSVWPTWEELSEPVRSAWRQLLVADVVTRGGLEYQYNLPASPRNPKQLYQKHRSAAQWNDFPPGDGSPHWVWDLWTNVQSPSFQVDFMPYGWESLQLLAANGWDYPDLRTKGIPQRLRSEGPPRRRRNLPDYVPPPYPRI